jgi:hypothetical protein
VTKGFSSVLLRASNPIEVNPITGNPHVVFQRKTEVPNGEGLDTVFAVYHTFRNAAGDWLTTPEVISEPRRRSAGSLPTMAFVGNGAAHVVWRDSVPFTSRGIMYSYCSSEGGTWSTPEWLTRYPQTGNGVPALAAEESARSIHAAWGNYVNFGSGCNEIWWKSYYPGGGGGGMARSLALSQSGIELFPNPAKAGRVTVKYSLPRAEPLRVTLLDVSGRTVRRSSFEARSSAEGSFSIDVRGVNAGVYVVKLESGASSLTRKLVIH